jgi:hypothetical protein
MKTKTFDCVEMKHRGAEKVREQTKDMTPEQELAFWHERSRILRRRQEIAKGKGLEQTNEEQQAS